MPADKEYVTQLALDRIAGVITATDDNILEQLIKEEPDARSIWEQLQQQFGTGSVKSLVNDLPDTLPVEKIWKQIHRTKRNRQLGMISLGITACLVVVFIVITVRPDRKSIVAVTAISRPASSHVTLSLSGGTILDLDTSASQELRLNDLLNDLRQYKGETATLNVPDGRLYSIQLSDGSRVRLNAGSSLQTPIVFEELTRAVHINGEAYFTITADPQHPFMVQMPDSSFVQVLGTVFNVNTYHSSHVRVALVKGAVKVITSHDSLLLQPGYAVDYGRGESLQPVPFDTANELSWMEGVYTYNNISMEELGRVISRYYGIRVLTEHTAEMAPTFTFTINKNIPLREFLEGFRFTGYLHFDIDKDSVLHLK